MDRLRRFFNSEYVMEGLKAAGVSGAREFLNSKMSPSPQTDEALIQSFTDLYWNKKAPWTNTFWGGHRVAKCPLDLWTFQEILVETKPELIIETGSSVGGSALFFASIFDMLGQGEILTIDTLTYPDRPQHPSIEYLTGDSTDPQIVEDVRCFIRGRRTMVILDSLHTYDHVSAELLAYGELVSPGCYLIVEDTGVDESWGKPAAAAATREFLARHADFEVDLSREKHLLTLNPGGWIRRSGLFDNTLFHPLHSRSEPGG